MPLEVKRKEKESVQSLVRRFSTRLKKSGILKRAKKNRFREKEKSQQAKKRAALRREELKQEYERLQKMGKAK